MTSNLEVEVDGLTTEEKQLIENTLNQTVANMSEEVRLEYLKDVRLTFSKNNGIRKAN